MLIFSQMSLALNIYGDLWSIVFFHPGVYGGTAHKDRIVIDEYNKPGSEQFIFLSDDACTVLAIWVSNFRLLLSFHRFRLTLMPSYNADLEDLSNFKLEASVQQREGEDV